MTIIPGSLGEAWLVKTSVLNRNQSPNAVAEGDLFYLDLNAKVMKGTKENLQDFLLFRHTSNL
jgi:hypothetical protein